MALTRRIPRVNDTKVPGGRRQQTKTSSRKAGSSIRPLAVSSRPTGSDPQRIFS